MGREAKAGEERGGKEKGNEGEGWEMGGEGGRERIIQCHLH